MLVRRFRVVFLAFCLCAGAMFGCAAPGFALEAGAVVDGKAILKMGWGDNLCVLTFDDGPSLHTERLLDVLKERGIPATFFVVGRQVRYHPDIVRRIQAEGHEIGNHTLTHANLRRLSPEAQRAELVGVQTLLKELGVTSRYIRPPYGNYDKTTIEIAREQGAEIMLWSIDSMDWSKPARIENMRTQINGQKLRGVFLFHDTHSQTVDAMPAILDHLIAEGCRFVTVSEYLSLVRKQGQHPLQTNQSPVTPSPSAAPASPVAPGGAVAPVETDTPALPADRGVEIRQPFKNPSKDADSEQLVGHSSATDTDGTDVFETSMLEADEQS